MEVHQMKSINEKDQLSGLVIIGTVKERSRRYANVRGSQVEIVTYVGFLIHPVWFNTTWGSLRSLSLTQCWFHRHTVSFADLAVSHRHFSLLSFHSLGTPCAERAAWNHRPVQTYHGSAH